MKSKLVTLVTILFILVGGIASGDEPRPIGLVLGNSTTEDVVKAFSTKGAREIFKDKAYAVITETRHGLVVGFLPSSLSGTVPSNKLVELPGLSAVIAYNIPSLGKDSFALAFFKDGKLFSLNYLIPLKQENRDVIFRTLYVLRRKYKFENLGKSWEKMFKEVEKGVKESFNLEQFRFSGLSIATHGNVVIGISVMEGDGYGFLSLEYANSQMLESVSNHARKMYRKIRNFESLF